MAISESVFSTSFRTNWIIMIIFLGLDLSSKIWIRLNVPLYETTELLANILDLTHVQNR
ncbi:MAG TPA: signal peptidase II, partial [Deltaproteobacteria bacterium]|nr:signal peptidase II [Deltaproteobacteria bacterium]